LIIVCCVCVCAEGQQGQEGLVAYWAFDGNLRGFQEESKNSFFSYQQFSSGWAYTYQEIWARLNKIAQQKIPFLA
jgi:hypothetical protein